MFRASKLVTWAAASLLLVGCSVIASVARADGNARVEFPISVLFPNPCNSENVTLHGAADICTTRMRPAQAVRIMSSRCASRARARGTLGTTTS